MKKFKVLVSCVLAIGILFSVTGCSNDSVDNEPKSGLANIFSTESAETESDIQEDEIEEEVKNQELGKENFNGGEATSNESDEIKVTSEETSSEESNTEESETEAPEEKSEKTDNVLSAKSSIEDDILLAVTYDFGKYDFNSWKITDSKSIRLTAILEAIPKGAEVIVEKVEIQSLLKSEVSKIDDLCQSAIKDSYQNNVQGGFLITKEYPYELNFTIDGYSDSLTEKWDDLYGSSGFLGLSKTELNEVNLIQVGGVTANQIKVVYTFMVKYKGEEKYHKREIVHEFTVPVFFVENEK